MVRPTWISSRLKHSQSARRRCAHWRRSPPRPAHRCGRCARSTACAVTAPVLGSIRRRATYRSAGQDSQRPGFQGVATRQFSEYIGTLSASQLAAAASPAPTSPSWSAVNLAIRAAYRSNRCRHAPDPWVAELRLHRWQIPGRRWQRHDEAVDDERMRVLPARRVRWWPRGCGDQGAGGDCFRTAAEP